ncbi:MAG: hypothetical protein IKS17_10435 [Firmicutes bacterium]|nr:hypothetical protein [Bacillota bacterium]
MRKYMGERYLCRMFLIFSILIMLLTTACSSDYSANSSGTSSSENTFSVSELSKIEIEVTNVRRDGDWVRFDYKVKNSLDFEISQIEIRFNVLDETGKPITSDCRFDANIPAGQFSESSWWVVYSGDFSGISPEIKYLSDGNGKHYGKI